MIFAPLLNLALKQDDIGQIDVYSKTVEFVDTVRSQGYISPDTYTKFVNAIDSTGNIYDIKIILKKKKVIPVYTDPTQSSTFQETYNVVYEEVPMSEILDKIFPDVVPAKNTDAYYGCTKGDLFYVKVVNKNATTGTKLLRYLSISAPLEQILASYGGMIRDSANF